VSPTNSIDYLPYNSIQRAVTEGMNHITSMTKSTIMPHIARYSNFHLYQTSAACISLVYIKKYKHNCIFFQPSLPVTYFILLKLKVKVIWEFDLCERSIIVYVLHYVFVTNAVTQCSWQN
jgi:hypothetical protein